MGLSLDLFIKSSFLSKWKASTLLGHHLEPCGCQVIASLSLKNPLLLLLLLALQPVSDELLLELQGLHLCL